MPGIILPILTGPISHALHCCLPEDSHQLCKHSRHHILSHLLAPRLGHLVRGPSRGTAYVTPAPTQLQSAITAYVTLTAITSYVTHHGRIQRGGGGGGGGGLGVQTPPEKSQNIEFRSNTGPDSLKNHKAFKPAFNVGPSSACQRNAI